MGRTTCTRHPADVGRRYGFQDGSARRRGPSPQGRTRDFRLCESPGELLCGDHRMVLPAARLGPGAGMDTPRDRCDSGLVGHSPGADPSGRQGADADTRLQPLFHIRRQQRLRSRRVRPDLPRQHLHGRFRSPRTHGGRSGREADATLQSPQSCGTGLDTGGAAAHRRNLPAPRRLRRRRRNSLRAGDARLPLHAVRLAFGRVRPAFGHLHLPQQGFQPRGTAGRQHLRRGCHNPGTHRTGARPERDG